MFSSKSSGVRKNIGWNETLHHRESIRLKKKESWWIFSAEYLEAGGMCLTPMDVWSLKKFPFPELAFNLNIPLPKTKQILPWKDAFFPQIVPTIHVFRIKLAVSFTGWYVESTVCVRWCSFSTLVLPHASGTYEITICMREKLEPMKRRSETRAEVLGCPRKLVNG